MGGASIGFHVEDISGQQVRFVIPAKRTWEAAAVLTVALLAWLACELVVGGVLLSLLSGRAPNPGGAGGVIFLAAWLLFWTYGGLMVAYQWIWLFAGREIVELGRGVLQLERVIPAYTRRREFDLTDIHDLHYDEDGQLRFSVQDESVEFGEALDALSARVLLEEIAVREPQIIDDIFFDRYLSEAA